MADGESIVSKASSHFEVRQASAWCVLSVVRKEARLARRHFPSFKEPEIE